MDINGNMKIENFELVIDRVSEGVNVDVNPSMITEDMAAGAIKKNIEDNRVFNLNVNLAIYDLLRNDLLQGSNSNMRDR